MVDIQKIALHVTIAFIGLIIVIGSFGTIEAGERGVRTRLGAVVGVHEPGVYFKLPLIEKMNKMEVKTRTINYDQNGFEGDSVDSSQLSGASKDLQNVWIGVVVNYRVDTAKVTEIYSQYRSIENYEMNIIEPVIREVVKSTAAQYTAEELVTKRAEFGERVNMVLAERFTSKNAVLERFSVTNFEFSTAFTEAIETKVTAVQNAEAAKNKLEQIKFEAQQTIETAKATAEAQRIQAASLAAQGGQDYVQLKTIEKWDGHLPQQMIPNATVPFLDITPFRGL